MTFASVGQVPVITISQSTLLLMLAGVCGFLLLVIVGLLLRIMFTRRTEGFVIQPPTTDLTAMADSILGRQPSAPASGPTTERLELLLDQAAGSADRLEELIALADERMSEMADERTQSRERFFDPGDRFSLRETGSTIQVESAVEEVVVVENNGGTPQAGAARLDPLTRTVYELADEGKTAVQIARQLDEHLGKVELILALREG